MPQQTIIIAAALLLLALQLLLEVHRRPRLRLVSKILLSALFVVTAALQPSPANEQYQPLIITGLVLCLAGDILLGIKGTKTFLAGMVAFLLGHGAYIAAFVTLARMSWLTTPAMAIHGIIAAGTLRWLRPHVGRLVNPVLVYILALTAMVIAAWSVMGTATLPQPARLAILGGALLFYASDLFVARHRFVKEHQLNRLVGLPAYYAGQFLLAFSIGLLST